MKREALPLAAVKFGDERAAIRRAFMVVEFTLDGHVLDANAHFLQTFGYTLQEIIGRHHSIFVHRDERESTQYQAFWKTLENGEYQTAQYRRIDRDGQDVWIQASYSPILDTTGQPYKIIKFASDVTAQKNRDADMSGQIDAIRRSLLVVEFSLDGTILDANQNFLNTFGYELADIKGRHHAIFVDPASQSPEEFVRFWALLRAGTYQAAQFVRIDKHGRQVWIQASYSPIFDASGRAYKVVKYATDITRQKEIDREREAQIQFSAHHDHLTTLSNRLGMEAYIEEQLLAGDDTGRWLSVILIDLDGFKSINDNYGHAVGDALLRAVADRMQTLVRTCDFIARLGGDEFAIVVKMGSPDSALPQALAVRLLESLRTPFHLHGHALAISASVGIATADTPRMTVDKLIDNADAALYNVKENGRDGIRVFDAGLRKATQERREMELLLSQAIAKGELRLIFQPIVSTSTGDLLGLEALCRWDCPVLGPVSPAVFIPLAERTGHINALGGWVIRQAVSEVAKWPESLFLSINVSPKQLGSNQVVSQLQAILAETGVNPSRIELEVTETVLLKQDAAILAELTRLQTLGVKISLDDFGTGFSSLSYLKMFPFHKIKIDRSFVMDLQDNRQSSAIVFASALLANQLDILVTAEGVETREQLDLVTMAGCGMAQGYLFGQIWDGRMRYEQKVAEGV